MVKKLKSIKQISNLDKKDKKRKRLQEVKITLKNILTSKKVNKSNENYDENKYSKYITDIFNSKIIYMLIIYMNKNKNILKRYKYDIEPNFLNKFIHLIKELNLNEIEVTYMTILLDKLGWGFRNLEHWIYFYSLGIYTKKIVTGELESDELLKLKEEMREKYIDLINDDIFEDLEKNKITIHEINKRYKELIKPINSYCRKNFINYTSITDKIIRYSQPYGSESNGNQLFIQKKLDDENKIKEEKEKKNNYLFGDNYNIYNNNQINAFSVNINDINKFNQIKNMSIIADKNNFKQINFNANMPTILDLPNISGSQLSLGKHSSNISLNSDIKSSNPNF